jgi:methyl-accepting chemotaxis protein
VSIATKQPARARVAQARAAVTAAASGRRQRLRHVREVLEAIGRGDLSGHIPIETDDDLAAVERAVNQVADQMRLLVLGLERSVGALEARSREVDEIGISMMSSAEETAIQAIAVSAAASQVSSSTQLVATATEELGATIRSVAESAVEASEISVAAPDRAVVVRDTVGELSRASHSVGDVTGLITAIAGRTRMLSLNARIEAARAGSAGRGFDVVAGEVKELARETAEATNSAEQTLSEIHIGSDRATAAIDDIASTITLVTELQGSIATAVEEQTHTAFELGRASAEAARAAGAIEGSIETIANIARTIAYGGPAARNTASEIGEIHTRLRELLGTYDVTSLHDLFPVEAAPLVVPRAVVSNGVTTITCDVVTGTDHFEYVGKWCRSDANQLSGEADAYSSMPNDLAILRFSGRLVRLYCNTDSHHGMMGVRIDGGPEAIVDQFSAQRRRTVQLWQSPALASGEHTLEVRVLAVKNPASRYFWVTVDRVEIE